MYLADTHRTVLQRLRLTASPALGAGNFFWHAWSVAGDRDRPVLFHAPRGADGARGYRGLSLDDVKATVQRYAGWYANHGVGAGDHVGVQTADGITGLLHHIAVTGLGGVSVLANPNMTAAVAADYFVRTQVKLVVADPGRPELLRAAAREDGLALPYCETTDAVEATGAELALSGGPWHRHGDEDLVLIAHSSGTTGKPKATSFGHRTFFSGRRARLWNFPSTRSDRIVTALPHSHSAGISYVSLAMLLGIPTVMVDDRSGEAVYDAVRHFRPTVTIAFPITLAEISRQETSAEAVGSVRTWMGMGDASHESHIRPLVAHGARYLDGLGSSEMGMVLFNQAHTATSNTYERRIGAPVRSLRSAAVLAEDGSELPDGTAGMLGVDGGSVTPGYWDDPSLTDDARLGRYFLTGDMVRRDPDGTWYHLDRTPDVITTADGPVYSLPLEEVVLTETDSRDAAVVAVDAPDAQASAPLAVVLEPRTGSGPEDMLASCNAALAARGLAPLGGLVIVENRDQMPVGPTGKVLKRTLREAYRDRLTDCSDAAAQGAAVVRHQGVTA